MVRRVLGLDERIEESVEWLPCALHAVNALAWEREELLCFPVSPALRRVRLAVRGLPSQRSPAGDELCFLALLAPMATASFLVEPGSADTRPRLAPARSGGQWLLRNRFVEAAFDAASGGLRRLGNASLAAFFEVFNTSHVPGEHMSNRYFALFNSSAPHAPDVPGPPRAWLLRGPVFSEVVQEVDARNLTLSFRLPGDGCRTRELCAFLQATARVGPVGWNNDVFLAFAQRADGGSEQLSFATDQNGLFLRPRSPYCPNCTLGGLLQPGTVHAALGPLRLFADRPRAYMAQVLVSRCFLRFFFFFCRGRCCGRRCTGASTAPTRWC